MADNSPTNEQLGNPLLQITFDDPEKKQDKEYGRNILSTIYKEQNQTNQFYFGGRNIQWLENWTWAIGRQNMKEFADYVSTDGNKAFTNVDMTPNRLGPQFVETLVNSMAQNEEYACVTAIDDGSISEKEQRKLDALFRMNETDTIDKLQQQSGVQLEPSNAYVPDDELSAEVYFKLEDRLPKEIEFEEKIDKTMYDNEYKPKSRQTKRDLIVLNCAATKIEKSDNGFISIRKCVPANLIYNFFMSDSGKMELSYIGERYNLKVRDLRKKYGQSESNKKGLTEKELFDLAKTATRFNNSNRFIFQWADAYAYQSTRPYDDFGVEVFDCEVKTIDCDYYVNKTDSFGKENIQPKKGIPQPQSDKATTLKKDKITWYRGIWAVKADKMIFWGYPDVTIKPYMDISESLSSYSIQIPNNDGDYVPSLFERALSPLRRWTLADLKVKQIIANLRPSGIAFDVEQMRDFDLGEGNVLSPMMMLKIYNQTGNVPYSSRGIDPNQMQGVPIHELPNAGSAAQLQMLSEVLASTIQEIRSLLGVPLYRDGSDLPPRMGAAVVENQTANSNNVTDFILHSDNALWQETLHKCCILHWDEVVLKQNNSALMDTIFEVKVEMKATAYEKQMLETNIKIGMQSVDQATGKPLLSFKDAFKIRNIKNYKLAELYLSNITESNERRYEKQKAQDQQANIQSQQQSAQMAAQQSQQLQQEKAQMDAQMADATLRRQKELALLNGALTMADTCISKGVDLPDIWKPLIAQVISNVAMPLTVENKQMQQGMQQMQNHDIAHQYAMSQQGQQQPQSPQEEQQEQSQQEMVEQ